MLDSLRLLSVATSSSSCLYYWRVLWSSPSALEPVWELQLGEIWAFFSPFPLSGARWLQHRGARGRWRCRRWDPWWPWEPSAPPAVSEHSRLFHTRLSASWQILNEEISLQVALVSENSYRASGGWRHQNILNLFKSIDVVGKLFLKASAHQTCVNIDMM